MGHRRTLKSDVRRIVRWARRGPLDEPAVILAGVFFALVIVYGFIIAAVALVDAATSHH